jgi:hypothetical protein
VAVEVTSTASPATSIESDPDVRKVMAVLKHHRTLESILDDDVGPRHEKGLASDDELQRACSDIANSENDLFELGNLLLELDLQDVDEDDPSAEVPFASAEDVPPESKEDEPPESKSDDPTAASPPASGFVKRDLRDYTTSEGNPNWDKIEKFYEATPSSREKDAIKRILDLRDTPDIKEGGEVHHIFPRSLGGSNNKANLRRAETVEHLYQHGSLYVISSNWQNASAFAFMTDTRGKRTGMRHVLDEDLDRRCARQVTTWATSDGAAGSLRHGEQSPWRPAHRSRGEVCWPKSTIQGPTRDSAGSRESTFGSKSPRKSKQGRQGDGHHNRSAAQECEWGQHHTLLQDTHEESLLFGTRRKKRLLRLRLQSTQ